MTSAAKPAPLSKADFTAMAAIAKARKENLQTMFKGATIVYGKTSAVGSAKSIASVFTECPLVGSYLIAYSPTSMVLNFFVADIGLPGWMPRLEEFKKQGLDPIIEVAEKQIERSRITITGFQTGKGVVAEKSIKEKVSSLNSKNIKFQFNRVVRSKLPF